MSRKKYTPTFKLQVVVEALQSDKSDAAVARAYGVHPVTLSNWKKKLLQDGAEVFGQNSTIREYEKRIAQLERMLGQKEVELALLKNFSEGS